MFKRLFGQSPKPTPQSVFEPVNDFLKNYDRAVYSLTAAKTAPTGSAALSDFEKLIGYSLPPDFRAFTMSPLCGLSIEVRHEIWPDPAAYEIRPAWAFQSGFTVFGLSPELPPEFNIQYHHELMFMQHRISDLLPFLSRKGASFLYCFTPDKKVVRWYSSTPTEREAVPGDFANVLASEIRMLEERRLKKIRGDDKKEIA